MLHITEKNTWAFLTQAMSHFDSFVDAVLMPYVTISVGHHTNELFDRIT